MLQAPNLRSTSSLPTCPLCRAGLREGQDRPCLGCGTRYHLDCLSELGGCSTLGCSSFGLAPRPDQPRPARQVTCSVCSVEATVRELAPCPGCGEFTHPSCASETGCRSTGCPYAAPRARGIGAATRRPDPTRLRDSATSERILALLTVAVILGFMVVIVQFNLGQDAVAGIVIVSALFLEICICFGLRKRFESSSD